MSHERSKAPAPATPTKRARSAVAAAAAAAAEEEEEEHANARTVYFWHEWERPYGCFSNWFQRSFTYKGLQFVNSEQALMWEKATRFDAAMCAHIMAESDPAKLKHLGRQIRNYQAPVWEAARYTVMVHILLSKFGQNPDLAAVLLASGSAQVAEASPFDDTWGIKFDAANAEVNRHRWGRNLLGQALVQARVTLGGQAAVLPVAAHAAMAVAAPAAARHPHVDLCNNCKARPKHHGFEFCGVSCGREWKAKICAHCKAKPKHHGFEFCGRTCGQAAAAAAAQATAASGGVWGKGGKRRK